MVSSISQIPVWIYGVLVVLGWNEFIAILRNPIYFTFLLLVAAGAAVTIQLGMASGSRFQDKNLGTVSLTSVLFLGRRRLDR